MTGDLLINGVDAYTYGVVMGEGFIGALLAPPPQKDNIENSSRNENGKRIIPNPKMEDRTLNLVFNVEGSTSSVFVANLKTLYSAFGGGELKINVPSVGSEIYKLYYKKSTQYAVNTEMTFCKITATFSEPDPSDRS
jgi:hypothetical protein